MKDFTCVMSDKPTSVFLNFSALPLERMKLYSKTLVLSRVCLQSWISLTSLLPASMQIPRDVSASSRAVQGSTTMTDTQICCSAFILSGGEISKSVFAFSVFLIMIVQVLRKLIFHFTCSLWFPFLVPFFQPQIESLT